MNNFTFSKINRQIGLTILFSFLFLFNSYQSRAQFTPGDLIVYRVDNGSSTLNTSAAVNVYLDEYTTTGTAQTPVVSVTLPATAGTAGVTESGKATSDALMRLSTNNQYLLFTGYLATLGTAGIVTSSSTTYPRVIGTINSSEEVNTSTEITDGYDNNNIRCANSTDGNEFWVSGDDAVSGPRYVAAPGNTTSVALSTAQATTNDVTIINGQLYYSVKTTGVYTLGNGLPTTTGQTMTLLSNTGSVGGEDFVMFDVSGSSYPQLLYIADQTNGIYKYTSIDGTTWTQVGTYLTVTGGADGITGYVDCNGDAHLFFTDNPGLEGNDLWSVTDANAYASGTAISGTATMLATASSTAPHQAGFRGVAFAPVASYPTVAAATLTPTICDGGSGATIGAAEVIGATPVQGVTYTWSPSAGLSVTTGEEVTAAPTVTTTYTVEATSPYPNTASSPVTGEGCISTTVVITVNQPPTTDAGNASTTVCSGSSYNVANAAVTNDASYSWSSSSGCSACFSSTTDLNPVYTPNATDINNGTVTITLTATGNSPCDNVTASKIITITKAPVANSGNNNADSICPGATYTVTNASTSNSTSFVWTSSSGCGACFSSTTTLNPVYTPSSTDITNGIVTITLTATGNSPCGSDSSSKKIAIDTGAHTVTVLPLSPTVCSGERISLSVAAVGNSFTWTPSAGLTSTAGDTVVATPTIATKYTVSGTDSYGCKLTGTDSVLIGSAPPLSIVPPSAILCSGLSASFKISGDGSGFVWSPSIGLNTTAGDSVIATPAGSATYTATGTDSLGCLASGSVGIDVVSSPNKPTFYQHGDTLISSSKNDNQWYYNGTLLSDTSQRLMISDTGSYWVVVANEANGCSASSDTMLVNEVTGIIKLAGTSEQLSVYPNPFTNQLFVKINSMVSNVSNWNLLITDELGRTLLTKMALNYTNEFDFSNLPPGIYFITVVNNSGRSVFPVFKQN